MNSDQAVLPSENNSKAASDNTAWREIVSPYQRPRLARSIWQIVNSVGLYLVLWYFMFLSLSFSYWLTAGLALLTGGVLVRIFIIFHDCVHGSFFKSKRANDICGFFTGLLVFTSYHHWRWEHSVHHANAGDLDGRGMGDVWTMTVDEYLAAPRMTRFWYRLNRNPIVLFVIAPLVLFVVLHRVPLKKATKTTRRFTHITNFSLLLMVVAMSLVFGWKAYLILQSVVLFIGAASGVWLFYVQHQFEGVNWERKESWSFLQAALEGSSFYKLPRILQWFSGNIGFHHIHHLSPRIPNYNLEDCHHADPLFHEIEPVTLGKSMKSFTFRLWDEEGRKLVGYDHLRALRRKVAEQAS